MTQTGFDRKRPARVVISLLKRQKKHTFADGIEIWCNGSTRDFGSLCRGSNPLISTNGCQEFAEIGRFLDIYFAEYEILRTFALPIRARRVIAGGKWWKLIKIKIK